MPTFPCPLRHLRLAATLGLAAVLLLSFTAHSQQGERQPKKVLTPGQVAYHQATAQWLVQYNGLRQTARQALAAEQAREKAGDCPQADTTLAEEQCLTREIATTQANYATVTGALRAMLGLAPPTLPGQQPSIGPTGTRPSAAARVAAFDTLEASSAAYRKLAAKAAYSEFKGGTLAPVFAAEAGQKLLRSHLDELAFIYDTEFSTR